MPSTVTPDPSHQSLYLQVVDGGRAVLFLPAMAAFGLAAFIEDGHRLVSRASLHLLVKCSAKATLGANLLGRVHVLPGGRPS